MSPESPTVPGLCRGHLGRRGLALQGAGIYPVRSGLPGVVSEDQPDSEGVDPQQNPMAPDPTRRPDDPTTRRPDDPTTRHESRSLARWSPAAAAQNCHRRRSGARRGSRAIWDMWDEAPSQFGMSFLVGLVARWDKDPRWDMFLRSELVF